MAERGKTWSEPEVAFLLQSWSEGSIQAQLLGAVRNEVPFKKIAEELCKAGYQRTFKQCRAKVKTLKKRYKDIVDGLRRSGAGVESDEEVTVPDCPWFGIVNDVMKHRAVTNPPNIIDSLVPTTQIAARVISDEEDVPLFEEDPSDSETLSTSTTPRESRSGTPSATTPRESRSGTPSATTPRESRSNSPTTAESTAGSSRFSGPKKKRQKITKMDRADKTTADLLDKVLKQQAEQRKKADELERERMKIEEERAERESRRDEQFMSLFGQLFATVRPPPHNSTPRRKRPPPYDSRFRFPPEDDDDYSDNTDY